ncbi:MAG: hypothetical protein QM723_30875 [Myxococcaceae bacterium]
MRLLLLAVVVAAPAFAQTPAPPEAVTPPAEEKPHYSPGWAREGGAIGFGVSVVPLGLAIASGASQWSKTNGQYDLTLADILIVCAGISAPTMALIPTFAGRSAVVPDDLAHAPRLLRILGWIMVGFATIDMVTAPLYEKAFALVFKDNGPSVFTVVTDVIAGLLAGGGILVLSVAARRSATRSEMPSEEVGPPATVFAPTVIPSIALVPGPHGGGVAVAGLTGTW